MRLSLTIAGLLLAALLLAPAAAAAQDAATPPDAAPPADTTATAEPAPGDSAGATDPAGAGANAQADAAADGTGRIVFFRPRKFTGSAIAFKVREGEAVLGKLTNGSFFVAEVPAGTHAYHVRSEGKDDQLVLEVEPGETYYVSAGISMGVFAGQGNLSPSDQAAFEAAQAKKPLKDRSGEAVD